MVVRIVRGAMAGAVATCVMSVFLGFAKRKNWIHTPPPKIIVKHVVPALKEDEVNVLSVVAHFAYGMGAGAAYSLLPRRGPLIAVGYGLLVWATSYEGWLPLGGILPPAHLDSRPRAVTMVAAHIVYGAVLGQADRGISSAQSGRSVKA